MSTTQNVKTSHKKKHYDLIIVGGGLAGATLACAIKNCAHDLPIKIAVIEAYSLNTKQQPCYDDRTVALSYGSRVILDNMGLWPAFKPYAQPIDNIHISDRGHFGVTRISKEQEGVEALGYVLENRDLGQQLYQVLTSQEPTDNNVQKKQKPLVSIDLYCPAKVTKLQQTDEQVSLLFESEKKAHHITANLLVAADGNRSQIMKMLAIGNSRQNYHQSAVITNVSTQNSHKNIAYERFTDSGPLAFLPMTKNRCSVVWSVSPDDALQLQNISDEAFIKKLQQRFGYRLGQITKTGKRDIYPLFLQSAVQMKTKRVVIIGNAAHSVHPVAGQGFNLALRDVAILSGLIIQAQQTKQDIGSAQLLQNYVQQREQDIKQTYRFTDTLVKTFSNKLPLLGHLRAIGLLTADIFPILKHQLAKQSMGTNIDTSILQQSAS